MPRSETTAPLTPLGWLVQVLGWLALFGSLALLSPGVVVTANAETGRASAETEECQAGEGPEAVIADLEQAVERAARRGAGPGRRRARRWHR